MGDRRGWGNYLQRFSTKVLWHFTGYQKTDEKAFAILKAIASEGQFKISEGRPEIKMPGGETRYGYPASCMCDIPFKDLRIHTSRYGKFGIAFDKTNAIESGHFNPVLYIHHEHPLFEHAGKLLPMLDSFAHQDQTLREIVGQFLYLIGTYVKGGDLTREVKFDDPKLDETQLNNFYYEREWRSYKRWNFKRGDVVAVMVENENYIEQFQEHLESLTPDKQDIFKNVPILSHELINDL